MAAGSSEEDQVSLNRIIIMANINLQYGVAAPTVSFVQRHFVNIPQENDAMTTHSATHQGLERILSISALLRRLVRAIARSLAINPK